ncbi:MAG: phenylalanine--tRNA ligase subunit alpha, partial [Burkholderiaceae bacterium]|nr:phenylalanine--tRNA ligase subunit alpha [Burkholderiaceae bacterium]NCZ84229.1 phenylalanine--tRNA ligase subunit alpha [Burkholderiaceae bacterium]
MVSLDQLVEDAKRDFSKASDPAALEDAKARYLGKSGLLTERLKALGGMSPEERKSAGAEINRAKTAVEDALNARRQALADQVLQARLAAEAIDVSLPGRGQALGSLHPVMRTWERVETIFHSIGFDVADGPEIETDWFNFTALNSPENHPARSMQDTFYVDGNDAQGKPLLLRTHTSPIQVRYASEHVKRYGQDNMPPIKVIAPGRTYRVDSDATHSPMFHQVEGLWIARDV